MAPVNIRKELQSFVGQVLREGGEDPSLAYGRRGKGKGKGKGKGGKGKDVKGKGKGGKGKSKTGKGKSLGGDGNSRTPRRLLRKQKRQDKKARRDHFFGHKAEMKESKQSKESKGTKVTAKSKPRKTSMEGKNKLKRKFRDDDEEITSEDEGQEKDDDEDVDKAGSKPEESVEETAESEEPQASDAEESEAEAKAEEGSSGAQGGYLPPHLRAKARDGIQSQQRTLRGILNRVSEGNLDPSSMEIAKVLSGLVPQIGSAKAADAFVEALLSAAVEDPNISVLVLGCFAALVAACQVVFGPAFGAAALLKCLEMLKMKMSTSTDADPDEPNNDARIAKNCMVFTMLMFSFGILPGNVVFDVVRFVLKRPVTEVSAELSLTLLRYAGRKLRSDCPEDFREVLKFVTTEAGEAQTETNPDSKMQNRLDYLLKELNDLKNNKVSFAVMDRLKQTIGWLETAPLLKGRKVSDHLLSVPFRVLHDEVPANWPTQDASTTVLARSRTTSNQSDPLRQAAIAQRLTSELRQNLFVALMGAEDFEDAVERVSMAASGAKNGCAEACVVLFHCAIRERKPNAFYAHVAQSLCSRPAPAGKRYSHSMKRAAVQHIQQAHTYGVRAAVCLAELCAALMISSSVQLPLAVVRFTRFGGDEEGGGEGLQGVLGLLLRHLVESLLQRAVDSQIPSLFGPLRKYNDVREGMLLVLDGQVRPRLPPQASNPAIWDNFRLARKEVATAGHSSID